MTGQSIAGGFEIPQNQLNVVVGQVDDDQEYARYKVWELKEGNFVKYFVPIANKHDRSGNTIVIGYGANRAIN